MNFRYLLSVHYNIIKFLVNVTRLSRWALCIAKLDGAGVVSEDGNWLCLYNAQIKACKALLFRRLSCS